MGRLFWKFFSIFWLAALLLSLTIGGIFYIQHGLTNPSLENNIIRHHAQTSLSLASYIYQQEGEGSLIEFFYQNKETPFPSLLTLNEYDNDILGRAIPQAIIDHVHNLVLNNNYQGLLLSTDPFGNDLIIFSPEIVISTAKNVEELETLLINTEWYNKDLDIHQSVIIHIIDLKLIAVVSLVIAILFSGSLAWYFTQPIRVIKRAFFLLSQGQFDTRITQLMKGRQDEFTELAHHFDDMVDTIEHLLSVQQSLLHDVSHELRSPLARLQAAIGLAEQQPDELLNTLARISKETERIDDLVGQLLVLSRMSSGLSINQIESLSLLDVVTNIIEDAQFEAEQHNVNIKTVIPHELTYTADAELIHRAIENIVRNAIKFSPVGGEILIEVVANAVEIVVRIQDQGPGVPEEAIPLLFNPFFKATSNKNQQGVGLGMAITKRAIEAHGGRIIAYNRQPKGFCVEIIFPRESVIDKNKLHL